MTWIFEKLKYFIKQAIKKVGGLRSALSTIPPWILFLLSLFFICTSQKWEGRGREKSAKVALPFPLSFSLPPYPLPLSMPATQATALLYLNACNRLQSYYHALPHLKGKKRVIKFVSQKFNQKFDDYHWTPLADIQFTGLSLLCQCYMVYTALAHVTLIML